MTSTVFLPTIFGKIVSWVLNNFKSTFKEFMKNCGHGQGILIAFLVWKSGKKDNFPVKVGIKSFQRLLTLFFIKCG